MFRRFLSGKYRLIFSLTFSRPIGYSVLSCSLWVGLCCALPLAADEVVVGLKSKGTQTIGDMDLTSGVHGFQSFDSIPLTSTSIFNPPETQMTAGELWSFFNRQGLSSVDRIVLYLDVGKLNQTDMLTIQSMEFRIEDLREGTLIASSDIGRENTLVIPGYETTSHLPVARLEIDLPFDFMERFSKDSPERVWVNVEHNSPTGAHPLFFVEGKRKLISSANIFLLLAFVVFWIVVFYVLKKLTLQSNPQMQGR